jgi:hypothetical protein
MFLAAGPASERSRSAEDVIRMLSTTIVPDEILLRLMSVRPVDYTNAETRAEMERLSGCFEPTTELLRRTIDAVFWASLSDEEGKPALARVLFSDIRSPYCRFQPLEVSTTALCKLSPLLDLYSNALLIRRDAYIIGVGQWQNGDIRVIARRPGRLAVLDGSMVLGVFDKGDWVILGGSSINISAILQRALPDGEPRDRLLKATLIVRFAMTARRAGRGATFVLLPEAEQNGIGDTSYSIEEFTALPEALEAWRQASRNTPSMAVQDRNRKLVASAMAIAAAGAGIDGATIIDKTNLRLLGFGAKINARDSDFDIRLIELPTNDVRVINKEKTGGMRHQSAARLVNQNHDATVITVSQDGPVSLFVWDQDEARVIMFKHLDRYLEGEAELD